MPKPYFLARRGGLYVRFLVPLDLRDVVGSRFLIRTLFPALVSRDDRLAAVITGFTMLSKARQEEVWELIEQSLGADRAEEVHERLGKATPKAKKNPEDGRF